MSRTPPQPPLDARRLATTLLTLLIVAACAGAPTQTSSVTPSARADVRDEMGTTPRPADESAELECEREGYPCTPAEVGTAVLELEGRYVDEISDMLDAGSTYAEALAWIREQDGVVAAGAIDHELFFRLEGGQPMHVSEILEDEPASTSNIALGRAVAVASHSFTDDIRVSPPQIVVGEETPRDDRQNRKRALFLEPLHPDKNAGFDLVLDKLRELPDYDHPAAIVHKRGLQVTPNSFRDWRDFDAIFVATHGGTIGSSWLLTGIYDLRDRTLTRQEQCGDLLSEDWAQLQTRCVAIKHNRKWYLGIAVRGDFFTRTYGTNSLKRAIIYIGGCNGLNMPDIIDALAGSSSAYVSWNETTQTPYWEAAGIYLIDGLTRRWTVEQSMHLVCGSEIGCTVPDTGAMFTIHDNGPESRELRFHDVPTLLHPGSAPADLVSSARLVDGSKLEVRGVAGDGETDSLEVVVHLAGIIDTDDPRTDTATAANLYNLSFFVDEHAVGRDNLGRPGQATAQVEHLRGSTFRYSFIAELPFDVDPDGTDAVLKVVVDLPEGGTSEYEAGVTLSAGKDCSFRAIFNGGFIEDVFSRSTALVNEDDLLVHGTADAVLAEDGSGLVEVHFGGPLEGVGVDIFATLWRWADDDPQTIAMHSTGHFHMTGGGGVSVRSISEMTDDTLWAFISGPIWWDDEWAPLDLFISEFSDELVVGILSGEVRNLEADETARLRVEFRARTKVGSVASSECGLGF